MNRTILFIIALFCALALQAQIAYQVSVIDPVTGNPKANQSVNVEFTLTASDNTVVCRQSSQKTTDALGVISATIGNKDTFNNFDWNKLPLYISAKVDGITINKSQVATVPVAEYAKHTGSLTKERLVSKTWETRFYECDLFGNPTSSDPPIIHQYTFSNDGKAIEQIYNEYVEPPTISYSYEIIDNMVLLTHTKTPHRGCVLIYSPQTDRLITYYHF